MPEVMIHSGLALVSGWREAEKPPARWRVQEATLGLKHFSITADNY